MNRIFFVVILLCLFSSNGYAEKKSVSLSIPPELKKMLDKFSQAIANNEKTKASELSNFPLKNIVYLDKKTKSRNEFESSFEKSMLPFCYDKQKPEKNKNDNDWYLDCDGNVFYFGLRAGQWKYLGYENINE
jgi:hypothetical protein